MPSKALKNKVKLDRLTAIVAAVLAVAAGYIALRIFAAGPPSLSSACVKSSRVLRQKRVSPTTLAASNSATAATAITLGDSDGSQFEQHRPPRSWKPLMATDAELAYYGFPKRPTDPKGLADWNKTYKNFSGFEPVGDCVTNTRFGQIENDNNPTWAGWVATGHSNFTSSQTRVTVPRDIAACPHPSALGIWTGIGGQYPNNGKFYPNSGLFQNGIDDNGTGSLNNWTWFWEILPDKGHVVSGSSTPGQSIIFSTKYNPSYKSSGEVTFFWYNSSTGKSNNVVHVSGNIGTTQYPSYVPVNQLYDGRTAEAIVERPPTKLNPDGSFAAVADLRKWSTGPMAVSAVGAGYGGGSIAPVGNYPYIRSVMTTLKTNKVIASTHYLSTSSFQLNHSSICGE